MKHLPIVWQRLVSEQGSTCPRCHDTGQAVQQAVSQLRQSLEKLGLKSDKDRLTDVREAPPMDFYWAKVL